MRQEGRHRPQHVVRHRGSILAAHLFMSVTFETSQRPKSQLKAAEAALEAGQG